MKDIARQAWNTIKPEKDPVFDQAEISFQEKLEFAAQCVKNSGDAVTEFEKEVASILKKQNEPGPIPIIVPQPSTEAEVEAVAEPETAPKPTKARPKAKAKAAARKAVKTKTAKKK